MQEIVFGTSADELKDAVLARRKAMKHLGLLHTPCDRCGGYMNVMSDPANRTTECESCFIQRWVKEEMLKEFK